MIFLVKKKSDTFSRFHAIFEPLIRNRIHIVSCSVTATWTWSKLVGAKLLTVDLFIVPLIMLCIYQWNRLYDLDEDLINSPKRASLTIRYMRWIKHFCLFGVIFGVILSSLSGTVQGVFILSVVIHLGAFYSMPFLFSVKRLKNLILVKNLTSALGWTLLVVFYPSVHAGSNLTAEHWFAAMTMSTAVWMVELIWDIRDQKGDTIFGVKTIPVLSGVESTKRWISTINGCSALILIVGVSFGLESNLWLFLLLNNVLVHVWVTGNNEMLYNRNRSHLLVGLQTALMVSLGFFAIYLT